MQGGYNIVSMVELLDNEELAREAGEQLKHTLLMFDAFHDVEERAKKGNVVAKDVIQSWADAEWFLSKPALEEKITLTVFKVPGETNTDDLSPAPDAWSRPDIPLHANAMLKTSAKASSLKYRAPRARSSRSKTQSQRFPSGLCRRRRRHRLFA
ncbi:hypothetical protein DK37_25985 [Halomonas sp. SUBG004]|nr:hypothetical protein DK37_25985 [Halomonas sp. SUBG004]